MYYDTYGFDPGLRHGKLVKARFRPSRDNRLELIDWELKFSWPQKKSSMAPAIAQTGIGLKSPAREIYDLANLLLDSVKEEGTNYPIGVDYTPNSGYWSRRVMQHIKLAFFMGYTTRTLHTLGWPVIFISPNEVRGHVGLSQKADKQQVWKAYTSPGPLRIIKGVPNEEDLQDAILLAAIVAMVKHRGQ